VTGVSAVVVNHNAGEQIIDCLPSAAPFRTCPIGAFSTSCHLADGPVLLDAGGLDEAFFFYFEDLELGLRRRSLGHTLVLEPAASAWHDRGAGTPDLSYRDHRAYPRRRAFLTMRHRLQVTFLHDRLRTILLLVPALALYEVVTLVFATRRGWFGAWVAGWRWLLGHAPDLARRRRAIQARRRLDDGELLTGGPLPLAAGVLRSSIQFRVVSALTAILDGYWQLVRPLLGGRRAGPATGSSDAASFAASPQDAGRNGPPPQVPRRPMGREMAP
jgi:hypothetical protein